MAEFSRNRTTHPFKLFGITLFYFDLWKTENRVSALMLTAPLVMAAGSLPLVRAVAEWLVFGRLPIYYVALIAVSSFFAFISILPAWYGTLLWKDIKQGLEIFGEDHPTRFLRTYDQINRTIFFILFLALGILILNQYPPIRSDFTILASTPTQVIVTVLYIYSWTLTFEVIVLIIAKTRSPHYRRLLLAILSTLEDRRFPFVNDIIVYFNGFLRRVGWDVRICRGTALSPAIFAHPDLRGIAGRRLLMAFDQGTSLDFGNVIASMLHKTPEEIMEKPYLIQDWNGFIQTLVVILGFILSLILAVKLPIPTFS